ncbi:FH1/FH2 domain-containing protein 3 isoform X2 [Acanthopagrus latus]|uniref:FH1/FH2 domain-containing protein 3 isoform X2 n=1 Tax=Acanthopagrus latus TaxID=8177 RepID=UPI00187C3F08|nr:FH1/FH2 domain-containing protein 3 isoform X2 [Acanthopagrus latus]
MSCVGRLRSGCCIPLAEFALEEGAASHRSHRPGAKCSSPVRSLPHHLKRPQCPWIPPPRSDEPHLSARHPGSLLLDCCAHCPDSSALREANGEGPRITEGAGLCYCRRPAGSSLPGGAACLSEAVLSHPPIPFSQIALHGYIMATFVCRVQFLDDTDPFNSTNFPEPTRPPLYTFREDIPLINQIAGVHRLLKAPQKADDCALQLSHNGSYLDLESTLAEQKDELEGFQEEGGRGKKHGIILRTQLSVRVHACIEKLYNSTGRELRRALFSLKQIFQDDKDLVHEFVVEEGLTCLIKVGAEADQNYQNYILRALGQIMLYVDGMNGLISHNETVQWLYTLVGSKFRLVVKTALKLLLVFVEYTESNAALLIKAVNVVDAKRGTKLWSNVMEILDEKDGVDTELLVYAMTLINKTLAGLPDQDSYYDMVDCLEEQGIEAMAQRHLSRKGTDLDLVEQFNMYEMTLRHEDGDDETQLPPSARKDRRRASVGGTNERRGLERRRSRRHSLQNSRGHASAPASPSSPHTYTNSFLPFGGQRVEDISESLQTDINNSPTSYSARKPCWAERISANGTPYPGRHQAPTSPVHRFTSSATSAPDSKLVDRPALGGLLTSSYRQHQESLAAERERRRLEREERLQRIEREERNRFNRDSVDKREEARQAREERYKAVERLAAEEFERERPRVPARGRTEITLCLSSNPASRTASRCTTPSSIISQEDAAAAAQQTSGTVDIPEPNLDPQTRTKSPAPELTVSEPSPTPPSEPDEQQTQIEPPAETEDVVEAQSEENVVAEPVSDEQSAMEKEEKRELEEQRQCTDEAVVEEQVEEVKVGDVSEVGEPDAEVNVELEEEQPMERDVEDSVLLSEKERQNEEVNEKDNCSASSISSTSSTLEREEREEKVTNDIEAGQWTPCIKDTDVNDQCNKILNSKRFMLDMLYSQKPTSGDEGNVAETEKETCKCEKDAEVGDSSVASLASRISTLEAHRQAREENVKKMEVGHLDNQGSVRAVAEKFGDLVKGLTSPAEIEALKEQQQQQQQQSDKSSTAGTSSSPPKKESDHIWDQLMAAPRELRIKEMDFTDLKDEDDMDILDMDSMMGSSDLIPPPPPPPCSTALPPPPPLFGCPPPPPLLGKMMPPPPPFMPPIPPPSPQLSRGEAPLFQKKKKTIRLFWNEVRPTDWQCKSHKFCKESLWSKLEPIKLDTSKMEQLFESKSKELPVTKKAAVDGKRQEIIVLDSKRSNAINIGLTVLPPPRTIKTAILNFDEYALNKEGIEKILTMIPTEEEKQRIQEAQLVNPDIPLGSAEQFLLTLSSITELSARLQLWAFKMDYELVEKEVAEPLQDLKEGMDQLEKNKTLRYILTTLLAIGNFLNSTNAKGFELSYLEKVPEVKDTVHKQSLLHHVCSIVVEKFPDSTDLYSEIGAVTRLTKVDFDQLQDNLAQMERRCKASWDHLKVIAKHEMKPALKQKMSDFLKDCAERIIILKIVHRRIINRFHAFLLFLGHPVYAVREVSIHRFSKILSEFALEYRTTRERVLQQKQKRANHRERNKTRGKMITDSGKFGGAPSEAQESQPQGIQYAEDAAEHENMKAVLKSSLQGGESGASTVPGLRTRTRASSTRGRVPPWCSANDDPVNCTDDTADEIMERIVRSATQGPSQRTQPRERRRSRANRKSLRRTLKNGLTTEEANALGLSSGSEMQV